MGFDVLRADVDSIDAWLVSYTNDIAGSLQAVTEGAQGLSGLASFTGETAEAVKAYWGEAHVLATAAIALAGMELAMRCTEYAQGYDDIDTNKNARFSQETLETTSADYQGRQTDFADKDSQLKAAVDAVSDLIGGWTPSAAAITDNLSALATDPSTLCSSVSAYEASSASGLAASIDTLLASAQKLVELLTAGTGGTAYVPGSVASQPWAADLYAAIQTSQTYQEEHSDAYGAAIAGLQGRMQERYEEYVSAEAEMRKQEGIVQMGTAVITVLAGAAAIVLTAGAATPVVVGLFTVSTAFQASNFIEGYNNFQLGSASDITTVAFNPLRDTIFCGNQELYDGATFVAMMASSLAIPVGGVMSEASAAVRAGEMTLGQATRSYGPQFVRALVTGELQDQAVDFGLSVTVDPVCYALLGDGAAGQLVVQAIHTGAGMLDPFGGDADVDIDTTRRIRTADADVDMPRTGLDFSDDLGIDAGRLDVDTPEAVSAPSHIMLGDERVRVDTSSVISDVESGIVELDSSIRKGNFGEMKADADYTSAGYTRVSEDCVTSLDAPPHHGIDGVYYMEGRQPPYVIVESKYGTSQLSRLVDQTRQMSDKWISRKLKDAVGEDMTRVIRDAGYDRELYRVAPDGAGGFSVTTRQVDADGYVVRGSSGSVPGGGGG